MGSWLLVSQYTASTKNDGYLINIAGKQRMLSQRLDGYAQRFAVSDSSRAEVSEEIDQMLDEFHQAHLVLSQPRSQADQRYLELSPELYQIYFGMPHDLDRRVRAYQRRLVALLNSGGRQRAHKEALVTEIHALAQDILPRLDKAVKALENENHQKIRKLWIQYTVFSSLILFFIISIGLFVIRPLIRAKQHAFREKEYAQRAVSKQANVKEAFISNTSLEIDMLSKNLITKLEEISAQVNQEKLRAEIDEAKYIVKGFPNLSECYDQILQLQEEESQLLLEDFDMEELIEEVFPNETYRVKIDSIDQFHVRSDREKIKELFESLKQDLLDCDEAPKISVKIESLFENSSHVNFQVILEIKDFHRPRVFETKLLCNNHQAAGLRNHGLGPDITLAQNLCATLGARLECLHPDSESFAYFLILELEKSTKGDHRCLSA